MEPLPLGLCLSAVPCEVVVKLLFELLLEVDEGLLAHHFDLAGDSLIQHALPLDCLGRKPALSAFLVFAIWWLIYFVLVIHLVLFASGPISNGRARKLVLDVRLALRRLRELDEEVSHAPVLEELLFGFLAVLVHRLSHQFEIDCGAGDDSFDVLLLVVVGQYDREDRGCELQQLARVHWGDCVGGDHRGGELSL